MSPTPRRSRLKVQTMAKYLASLLFLIMACSAGMVNAATQEERFLTSIAGQWSGPGEVVAGKYKGTKFTCTFAGISAITEVGMTLDGTCRIGFFSQSIKAKFARGAAGYSGTFNEGAQAQGLDITSGRIKKNHMVFNLNRQRFNGSMTAHLADSNSMKITLAVKIESAVIPVIDMTLTRTGGAIGTLAKN